MRLPKKGPSIQLHEPPRTRGRWAVPYWIAGLALAGAIVLGTFSDRAPARSGVPGRHTGLASWYGPRFHGLATAQGEPFDMHALTAAHRSLPLGTRARVRNLENGRSVVVRINDRGPYRRDRKEVVIDLSWRAARDLGMARNGLARVEVVPL